MPTHRQRRDDGGNRRTAAPAATPGPVPPGETDLDEAVAAARRGEEWALTVLYRALHPGVVRYLRAHAPGAEEDLASEVWIQVAQALEDFEGNGEGLRRLVFTIARRRGIDHQRRRYRRRTDATDPGDLTGWPAPAGSVDPAAVVEERLTGDAAVARIMALLPSEQAEVILLRVVAGFSVAEVAEILGRRPAAVSLAQHRGLRKLARRLGNSVQDRISVQDQGLWQR